MSGVGTTLKVPRSVSARSPLGLQRAMLLNNLRDGSQYQYQDIQFVNGQWFAWYFKIISMNEAQDVLLSETIKK